LPVNTLRATLRAVSVLTVLNWLISRASAVVLPVGADTLQETGGTMIKGVEQLAKISHFLDPVLNFRPSAFVKEIKHLLVNTSVKAK